MTWFVFWESGRWALGDKDFGSQSFESEAEARRFIEATRASPGIDKESLKFTLIEGREVEA